MPSLRIPESGVTIGGNSPKNGSPAIEMLGLTLGDSVIEEMIRCVQNGKPIQLSLGGSPTISYGSKLQHLAPSVDPFSTELFTTTQDTMERMASTKKPIPALGSLRMYQPSNKPAKEVRTSTATAATTPALSATGDAALAALQQSLASETLKKQENTTKIIKDLMPGKKGSKLAKSRFPQQGRSLNSHPASPALSGVGSPALGPTSVPLSQQQAELAKAARKPVIHLLAARPWTEIELREEVPQSTKAELREALDKVGDLNETTGKWELRRAFFKELDVWNFDYPEESDRQKAIDNAVKSFDKQRLATSEPQWEKLLPPHERGTGKCLSKLQAKIAAGPVQQAPKINVTKATDSGRDTPGGEEDGAGALSGRNTPKPKKLSAGEAQAKRLLSKKPPKSATPKPAPAKKAAPAPKAGSKILSSKYVQDSDEEDDHHRAPPAKPISKVSQKRTRDEDVDTSDTSIPLAKKVKKDPAPVPAPHRVSDASQTSRTTNSSTYSSYGSSKNKSNSPQKSSPLASSPPTNASDFEDHTSTSRHSSSASPPRLSTKNTYSPIHKRHGKSSSVSSSNSSSSSRYLRPEVTDIARKYRSFYPRYKELHEELSKMKGKRDKVKEQNLLEMHARLEQMKRDILAGIVEGDSS